MAEDELPADELSTDDLEQAYLRALDAMESSDWAIDDIEHDVVEEEIESTPDVDVTLESPPSVADRSYGPGVEIANADFLSPPELQTPQVDRTPAESRAQPPMGTGGESELGKPPVANDSAVTAARQHAKPFRVIEACLFVGGQPLSAKKLANLLDGNNDPADIEVLIDELNLEYSAQSRPYEIRLGDGGFRLTLRTEFDTVRSRVYGVGPRDVKLSQDVLEILALIAYQQPISQASIEACKPNSTNVLRQLLRRELISLTRVDQSRNGVEYRTTPRFLQLFGLGQLSELPRPEDLSIR